MYVKNRTPIQIKMILNSISIQGSSKKVRLRYSVGPITGLPNLALTLLLFRTEWLYFGNNLKPKFALSCNLIFTIFDKLNKSLMYQTYRGKNRHSAINSIVIQII